MAENTKIIETGQQVLNEIEAKELLRQAGIPVIETKLARTKSEAMRIARELGFPVVMKIVSPDAVHKSDVGGVKLNITSAAQAGRAYSEIIASLQAKIPDARIEGVSVQKMAPPGVEIIIGMSRDPQFGPVIMFGLGGIFVELLKDVSFRLVPVSPLDAAEMIQEIRARKMLEGFRGLPAVHIPTLEKLIVRVSDFIESHPDIVELDINPLIARGKDIVAVDARIVVE